MIEELKTQNELIEKTYIEENLIKKINRNNYYFNKKIIIKELLETFLKYEKRQS